MGTNIYKDLVALEQMSVGELRVHYARVFGEPTTSHNRVWLLRRIAWRMQALAEGGLSERARQRAMELANDADLRLGPPRVQPCQTLPISSALQLGDREKRPLPGTLIERLYKGRLLEVKVLTDGFEYDGNVYRSLSAVAKAITGSHCSGYGFFNLRAKEAS